jgi:hypothetical protein
MKQRAGAEGDDVGVGGRPAAMQARTAHANLELDRSPRIALSSLPMPTLRSKLHDLASSFASSVLDAVRSASLEELVGQAGGGARRGPGRPPSASATQAKPAKAARSGRLKRRSAEEISQVLDEIVALVKRNKAGLRAEQIREQLGMQAKEMPRVLKEGLAKKKLKSKGQKRATTYTAA